MSEPQTQAPKAESVRISLPSESHVPRFATVESVALTPAQLAARKRRNLIIAWSIIAFVVLVFAITLTQMAAHSGGRA